MASNLDGHLRKIEIAFLENCSDTMLYQIHSESLENCHFHIFAILVAEAVGHFGLLRCINLKGLHSQIILADFD